MLSKTMYLVRYTSFLFTVGKSVNQPRILKTHKESPTKNLFLSFFFLLLRPKASLTVKRCSALQSLTVYSQFKREVGARGRSQTDWEQFLALVHQGTAPHSVAALPCKSANTQFKGGAHQRKKPCGCRFTTHKLAPALTASHNWLLKILQHLLHTGTSVGVVPMLM